MKLRWVFALCALALSLVAPAYGRPKIKIAVPTGPKNAIVPGQLLIKLKARKGVSNISSASLPSGSKLVGTVGPLGWTLWSIPSNLDPRKVAINAMRDSSVGLAEPVNKVSLLVVDPNDGDYGVQETDPSVVLDFNDTGISFLRLWHIDETFARDSWDVFPNLYFNAGSKPTNTPTIALIDSGCDQNHPDFMNAGGTSTSTVLGGQLNWALSKHFANGVPDAASWNDDNGHGTHVAGIALASANNGTYNGHGVIGTGFNAQGMILKVIDRVGNGTDTDAAAAIFYAADHGADIINLSLGTTNYSQIFQDAVTYAYQKGSLVIAAGNENGNGGGNIGPIYPAACSGVLGVTAQGPQWTPATTDYAGYGNYVDISAPGGDVVQNPDYILIQYVWSTAMTTPGGPGSLYDLSNQGVLYPPYGLDYAYLAGTSMASPGVSGAAGLYYGFKGFRQAQGRVNVRAYRAIERSALSVLGAPNGAWEPVQGYGVLDVYDLLFESDSRDSTVGSIEGILYYGATPLANVGIRAQIPGNSTFYSTTTHGDGEYRFDSMPPGVYTLTAVPLGVPKQKKVIVGAGSDATGVDLWVNGDFFESTPPVVPFFNVTGVTANSVSFSEWGYDTETSIDSIKIRIGTTLGAQDVYPDTELVTETNDDTVTGFSLTSGNSYYLRATYTNGIGMQTTVDRTIQYGAPAIHGTITLQDYAGAPQQVTVLLRNPGSLVTLQTITFTPAGDGTFSFPAPAPGTYDMAFKASHWLRKKVANVVVTGSGASGLTPSLVNGDVNGDNVVSLGDLGLLRSSYGFSTGDANFNPNADLNGNGSVTLADLGILRSHFSQSGDQ